MFACRGLLTGPLFQRRSGGFALGPCSQVLGSGGIHVGLNYTYHRGITVAQISTAIVLKRFGGRQVVLVALCWSSGASCGIRVALQLAYDLWAVR